MLLYFFEEMMLDARLANEDRASSIEHPVEDCLTTYHFNQRGSYHLSLKKL